MMMWTMNPFRHALPIIAIVLSAPALAQAPLQTNPTLSADRSLMANCLRQGATASGSCIGLIAVACVTAAGQNRREAELGCARREEAVWRERLSLALQATGRPLDAGRRSRLAALHVAWEGYVAQKCAFFASTQREGFQVGRQAGCELREVAQRALELERSVPQATQRQPPSPPQIIR